MRRILVTGANKGIGLAIVRAILEKHDDTFVYLGSRDEARGREAVSSLGGALAKRVELVTIDVSDARSVAAARSKVNESLYGLVNNAGVSASAGFVPAIEVNTRGMHRVTEAFLPLVQPHGRIVNITSAAGPSFVAKCTPERQRFFLDGTTTWAKLDAFLDECIAAQEDPKRLGLGSADVYGLSKAVANTYTLVTAREHPELHVNACTPGFIETDLTRPWAQSSGKAPAEMGMKPPAAGTVAPTYLLFGELEGNGRYYGSDAKRSPLDRYREPGSPAFTGP